MCALAFFVLNMVALHVMKCTCGICCVREVGMVVVFLSKGILDFDYQYSDF